MKKNWVKIIQIALLFLGTYGERLFVLLHTLISNMKAEWFSFICLTIIFVVLTEIISKQ